MVEILVYNDTGLRDDEIDQVVTKAKAFIMSSKYNMLIGRNEAGYQLIETSVGAREDITTAMVNAIFNETGISLDSKDAIEPFFETRYYFRDYKNSGVNRLADTVYFLVKTEKLPNLKKLKVTQSELMKKLPMEVVKRSELIGTLENFIAEEKDILARVKAKEILLAFDKMRNVYDF
ncbi:MAG: hypothetical protein E7354_05140 [Clostridiales bacterium]|nr:hypothetical protein [Clostridiales bacterium]